MGTRATPNLYRYRRRPPSPCFQGKALKSMQTRDFLWLLLSCKAGVAHGGLTTAHRVQSPSTGSAHCPPASPSKEKEDSWRGGAQCFRARVGSGVLGLLQVFNRGQTQPTSRQREDRSTAGGWELDRALGTLRESEKGKQQTAWSLGSSARAVGTAGTLHHTLRTAA